MGRATWPRQTCALRGCRLTGKPLIGWAGAGICEEEEEEEA